MYKISKKITNRNSYLYSVDNYAEFIIASLLNHDDSVLKLQTIKDIFSIKSTNQQFKTRVGKLQFLTNIREKLKNLPYNTVELQRITYFLNEQERTLQATTRIFLPP